MVYDEVDKPVLLTRVPPLIINQFIHISMVLHINVELSTNIHLIGSVT